MIRKFSSTLLTLTVSCFLLWGCASEDLNSVNIDRTPATIPTDAVLITAANATAITIELQKITKAIRAASNAASKTCVPTGTITLAWLKTINPANGTLSFASCRDVNTTTSGALGFETNFSTITDYRLDSYGSLSVNDTGDDYRIFGIKFTEFGEAVNTGFFDYRRITTFAVTLNSDIGGGIDGGVLVSTDTDEDIVGVSSTCPNAGRLLVKGKSNSKMLITFLNAQTVRIEVDDGDGNADNSAFYVAIPGSPFLTNLPNHCFYRD